MTDLSELRTREWLALPEWVRDNLERYVATGELDRGTTLESALVNDFKATVCMAGDDLAPVLRELAVSLSCYVPSECHGSREAVTSWTEKGGAGW